jgi:NADPH:quinone reductase-like Zn-dependent oxidoreductase
VAYDRVEELGLRGLRGQRSAARLAGLVALWEAGDLRVVIRSIHPLGRAADAHREVETGHGRGKVVLRVG